MLKSRYQTLPAQVIEQRADALLREFERKRGWRPAPPVPVDEILEIGMKYHLSYGDLSTEVGVGVMGALYPETKEVRIDSSLESPRGNGGRHNFTIAHEIGHAVLHASASHTAATHRVANGTIVCRTPNSTVVDREADQFAACLLMPAEMVHRAIRSGDVIINENWSTSDDESSLLYELDFDDLVRQLASIFRVSLTAMEMRLKQIIPGPYSYEIAL